MRPPSFPAPCALSPRKDSATFKRVYRESSMVCYSCHEAPDQPDLRRPIPMTPETRGRRFDPKVDRSSRLPRLPARALRRLRPILSGLAGIASRSEESDS